MAGAPIRPGANIGTRPCFADIAATILEYFDIKETGIGNSFWSEISCQNQ
jgi:phosphopentomutase